MWYCKKTIRLWLAVSALLVLGGNVDVIRASVCRPNELAKLPAREAQASDLFGRAVAVSGQILIRGAYYDADNGVLAGAAYVFRYDGVRWLEEAKLLASDGGPGDLFGSGVAVSGERVVVGAPGYVEGESPARGAVYVFRHNGSSWVEEAKLLASDRRAYQYFGSGVAAAGNAVVVGAYEDNDHGVASGAAYVFRYSGSSWGEEAKLLASDAAAYDYFGASVALTGDVALIGAPGNDENGTDSGAAYLFHYDGLSWVEEAKLLASDGGEADRFGYEVALAGDVATIGAPGNADNVLVGFGSEYLFRGLTDCNSNGTLDICDIAIGASSDDNGNGLADECELTAVSTKTHGAAGDFAVNFLTAGAVEPRYGGPTHIVIGFQSEVEPADGSLDPGDEVGVSSGTITNLSIAGTELHAEIQGVDNNACLTLSLHGLLLEPDPQSSFVMADTDLHVGVISGDVNGDGIVDYFDYQWVKSYFFMPIASYSFRSDVEPDGYVDIGDLIRIKANIFKQGDGLTCP